MSLSVGRKTWVSFYACASLATSRPLLKEEVSGGLWAWSEVQAVTAVTVCQYNFTGGPPWSSYGSVTGEAGTTFPWRVPGLPDPLPLTERLMWCQISDTDMGSPTMGPCSGLDPTTIPERSPGWKG